MMRPYALIAERREDLMQCVVLGCRVRALGAPALTPLTYTKPRKAIERARDEGAWRLLIVDGANVTIADADRTGIRVQTDGDGALSAIQALRLDEPDPVADAMADLMWNAR